MREISKGQKIAKIFRGIVKSFDEKTHIATVVISTKAIDRDGEVIEPAAFQKRLGNYMAHPILLSSHRAENLMRQIGEAKEIKITDEGVEGIYEWYVGKGNAEADWGWFLVMRGIAAFSVGFIPFEWVDTQPGTDDRNKGIWRRYVDIELLENSQVLVPANPQALQRRISEVQGEEKELCELVAKEVKAEEMAPFDEVDESKMKKEDKEKQKITEEKSQMIREIIEEAIFVNEKFLARFKEMVSGETKKKMDELLQQYCDITAEKIVEMLIEKKSLPPHYSEILLGDGDQGLKHSPTKENENKQGVSVAIDTKSIADAVKSGFKEGLKNNE